MERLKEREPRPQGLTFESEEAASSPRKTREPSRNHKELDVLQLYLEEVRHIPLLTRDQEQELSRRKKEGEVAQRRLEEGNNLTPEEKGEFQLQIQEGQRARTHLITANQRLVMSIARRYKGQGVPFPDLVQEGTIGLIKAIDRFDHKRGYKLSTYATWWIRQTIARAVAGQSRNIYLPHYILEKIKTLKQAEAILAQELGREPTVEELAEWMGEDPEEIEKLRKAARLEPFSLDKPVSPQDGDETDSFGDFVENQEAVQPTDATVDSSLREQIEYVLEGLTPREEKVLRLRFGLEDGHSYTLQEIADELGGISRERVRQIEKEALERLRHPSRARKLRGFLEE